MHSSSFNFVVGDIHLINMVTSGSSVQNALCGVMKYATQLLTNVPIKINIFAHSVLIVNFIFCMLIKSNKIIFL